MALKVLNPVEFVLAADLMVYFDLILIYLMAGFFIDLFVIPLNIKLDKNYHTDGSWLVHRSTN
jgi:hypothetical protein